jgi:hypothetical protein
MARLAQSSSFAGIQRVTPPGGRGKPDYNKQWVEVLLLEKVDLSGYRIEYRDNTAWEDEAFTYITHSHRLQFISREPSQIESSLPAFSTIAATNLSGHLEVSCNKGIDACLLVFFCPQLHTN